MMGLAALQDSWPVSGWVLKLFDHVMARLRKPIPERAEAHQPGSQDMLETQPQSNTHQGSPNHTGYEPVNHASGALQGEYVQQYWPTETDYYESLPNMYLPDDALSNFNAAEANIFDWLGFQPVTELGHSWPNEARMV
jgi:hypothetical protein